MASSPPSGATATVASTAASSINPSQSNASVSAAPGLFATTCQVTQPPQSSLQTALIQGGFTFLGAALGAAVAIFTTRQLLKGHERREAAQRAEERAVERNQLIRDRIEEYLGLLESAVAFQDARFARVVQLGLAAKYAAKGVAAKYDDDVVAAKDPLDRASVIEEIYFPEATGVLFQFRKARVDGGKLVGEAMAQMKAAQETWFDEHADAFGDSTKPVVESIIVAQNKAVSVARKTLSSYAV